MSLGEIKKVEYIYFTGIYLKPGIDIVETDSSGTLWIKLKRDFACFLYGGICMILFYFLKPKWCKKVLYCKISIFGDLNARCGNKSDVFAS